jgi:hypothetical protein
MSINDPDRTIGATELAAIDFRSPGRFTVDSPQTQQIRTDELQPAPFILGATRTTQPFDSPDAARQHALALLVQAQRSLSLYSPDLEPWLYNHNSVQQACTRFLLAHPRNRLRILLGDSSRAVKQGHRLLTLARRLTSNMQIRKLHPDYPAQACAFLVADDCGVLVRPEPAQFSGHAFYQDPGRARQRQRQFDTAWDHSLSDPDLRSFLL